MLPSSVVSAPLRAPRPAVSAIFLQQHLVWPLSVALLLSALLMAGDGDQWIADQLYRLQGHQWALQHAWVTSALIHKGGKWLSTVAALLTMVLYLHAGRRSALRAWRWPLLYVVLAVAVGTGAVSLLKSLTQMDCPWDLARYGGAREFVGLFSARPVGMPKAGCFPAGHASAGYAWVCLYFFALMVRPQWRWRGLAVGLLAGGVFGVAQQLRGAHFLSHDLWTLATCWTVSVLLYVAGRGRGRAEPGATGAAR